MFRARNRRWSHTFFGCGRACLLVGALFFSRSAWANEPPEDRLPLAADLTDEDDLDDLDGLGAPPEPNSNAAPGLSLPVASPSAGSQFQPSSPARLADEAPALRWEIPPFPWRGTLSLTGGGSIPAEGAATKAFSGPVRVMSGNLGF
jgi:hypothetical protein